MARRYSVAVVVLILCFQSHSLLAQFNTKVASGQVVIDDGTLTPNENHYTGVLDRLKENLRKNPHDTTSLYLSSVLLLRFNSLMARPDLTNVRYLNNLLIGLQLADLADSLNMKDFKLKVIKAQLCKEITYRLSPAEPWRYNKQELADRRIKYLFYKNKTNSYLDQLAGIDTPDAYDFQRQKIK
jgi:hypothetical protein